MLTIHIDPGAIVVNMAPEMPAVLERLTAMEASLSQLAAKVETLVPDQAQVDKIVDDIKRNQDTLESAIQAARAALASL